LVERDAQSQPALRVAADTRRQPADAGDIGAVGSLHGFILERAHALVHGWDAGRAGRRQQTGKAFRIGKNCRCFLTRQGRGLA
jgi:hypothetical protein